MATHKGLLIGTIFSLFVIITLLSGCVDLAGTGESGEIDNTLNILKNPRIYLNKEVTIAGEPFPKWSEYDLTITEDDRINDYAISRTSEGKTLLIFINSDKLGCGRCKITGTVKSIKGCTCQSKVGGEWVLYSSPVIMNPEKCPEFTRLYEHRCGPETTKYYYYLDVLKVESLDTA